MKYFTNKGLMQRLMQSFMYVMRTIINYCNRFELKICKTNVLVFATID